MRDIENYVRMGKERILTNPDSDMSVHEYNALLEDFHNTADIDKAFWNAVTSAYYFGLESGYQLKDDAKR